MCERESGEMLQVMPDKGTSMAAAIEQFMETMARMLGNNTEALNRAAAAMNAQSDRIEALERQIRLNTPVTAQQVRFMGEAMRKRARDILAKYELQDDRKAVTRLSGMIRRAVLMRYGMGALNEIPRHEYGVVLSQAQTWNDALNVRDAVKEARARAVDQEERIPGAE